MILKSAVLLVLQACLLAKAQLPVETQVDHTPDARGVGQWDAVNHRPLYIGNSKSRVPILEFTSLSGKPIAISAASAFPAAKDVAMDDACGGPNGEVIGVARVVLDQTTVRSLVVFFSDEGKLQKVFDLSPYIGAAISADLEGHVTVLETKVSTEPFPTLATYSSSGDIIRQTLMSNSMLSKKFWVVSNNLGAPVVAEKSGETFVWVPNGEQVFVVSQNGSVSHKYTLSIPPSVLDGLANTTKGRVVTAFFTADGKLLFEWMGVSATQPENKSGVSSNYLFRVDPESNTISKKPLELGSESVHFLGVDSNGSIITSRQSSTKTKVYEMYQSQDVFKQSH